MYIVHGMYVLEDPSVLYICSTFVGMLNTLNNLYSLQRSWYRHIFLTSFALE